MTTISTTDNSQKRFLALNIKLENGEGKIEMFKGPHVALFHYEGSLQDAYMRISRGETIEITNLEIYSYKKEEPSTLLVEAPLYISERAKPYFFISLAQVSFSPTDLLNTGRPGFESASTT